jgi:hypothetical protein
MPIETKHHWKHEILAIILYSRLISTIEIPIAKPQG